MKKDNYCLGLSKVQLYAVAEDIATKVNKSIKEHNQKVKDSIIAYSKSAAFKKTKEAKLLIEFFSLNQKHELFSTYGRKLDYYLEDLAKSIIEKDKALRTKLKIANLKSPVNTSSIVNDFILESTKGDATLEALIKSLTDKYTK